MKYLFSICLCVLLSASVSARRCLVVEKGSVASLLETIKKANDMNAAEDSKRLFIIIPDGYYDLGKTVLTQITGNNIAIVGQSVDGTIIRNQPDFANEGISKTGIFQNRGKGNYFEDITLRNDLDYYACGSAGRAVTLHDKGTQTICNRVRMLSFQDTYYSDNELAQHYMENTEIHGTVDFICGAGDVWFERCKIVTEKRTLSGKGRNVIAAPRTSKTQWGYVFNNCVIDNIVSTFEYARGWHTLPRCAWLNTTLMHPELLSKTRYDHHGMRTVMSVFKEYHTMDASGNDITPKSNVVTLTLQQKRTEGDKEITVDQSRATETILNDTQAGWYTTDAVFTEWNPICLKKKLERQAKKLKKRYL